MSSSVMQKLVTVWQEIFSVKNPLRDSNRNTEFEKKFKQLEISLAIAESLVKVSQEILCF